MAKLLHWLVAIYSLLMLGHLGTSFWLFFTKIGGSLSAIQSYYLGGPQSGSKTVEGLLETAVPHLAAVGTVAFVLAHFLLFIPSLSIRAKFLWGGGFLLFGLVNSLSGLVIVSYGSFWTWLKVLSFVGFQITYLVLLVVIFYSAIQPLRFRAI